MTGRKNEMDLTLCLQMNIDAILRLDEEEDLWKRAINHVGIYKKGKGEQ